MSPSLAPTRRRLATASACLFAFVAALYCIYVAHTILGLGGKASNAAFQDVAYNVVMLGAALALIMRAASRTHDRMPVLLIGCGLLVWALGDLYWTLYYEELQNPPSPSIADAFYLAMYPLVYIGLGVLIRSRIRGVSAAMWLDGLIAGLGMGAVAAGLVLDPILQDTGGSLSVVAVNLAYPVGDLLLFLMVVAAISLTSWRPGWMWGLIAFGLVVQIAADTIFLFQEATGTYVEGTWLETMWPLAALVMVLALWLPTPRTVGRARSIGWRAVILPIGGGLAATGVLFVDHGEIQVNGPARVMALATLGAAALRVILSFRRSARSEEESRIQAVTDPLTGLGNRRMLADDLEAAIEAASERDPRLLVMYDLNGFKLYNDSFGHPAGDSLLVRLGRNLATTVAPYGTAYRMGGDEFCALMRPGDAPVDLLASLTRRALAETGNGFEIDAACGIARLPHDAKTPSGALQLADRRLYSSKESRPAGVKRQLRGVLLQVLGQREPALLDHLDGVAALALTVGRRMEIDAESLDVLVRAAEMHDVGKMAIPESILDKPGPLDAEEWTFMRRHTILGERILSAAPALLPVAQLVRSSHERWDGDGYPDGLAGTEIPLGSRIICACDAFDAIVTDRVYSAARSQEEALAELARCAGSQFDPDVVEALSAVVKEGLDYAGASLEDLRALAPSL
jgi:two-component system cell cycle response regulator